MSKYKFYNKLFLLSQLIPIHSQIHYGKLIMFNDSCFTLQYKTCWKKINIIFHSKNIAQFAGCQISITNNNRIYYFCHSSCLKLEIAGDFPPFLSRLLWNFDLFISGVDAWIFFIFTPNVWLCSLTFGAYVKDQSLMEL